MTAEAAVQIDCVANKKKEEIPNMGIKQFNLNSVWLFSVEMKRG